MRYIAVGPFLERKEGNDLDVMIEKVDELNSKSGPKWYIIGLSKDNYQGFIENKRNVVLYRDFVVYDPFNQAELDEKTDFYSKSFRKVFGKQENLAL